MDGSSPGGTTRPTWWDVRIRVGDRDWGNVVGPGARAAPPGRVVRV